jgi:putative hemolysin
MDLSGEIPYLPLRLCILAATLCLSAFFSGSETALFSFQPHELKRMAEGSRTDRLVAGLRERPRRLLTTILFCNMVVNVVFYSVSFLLIVQLDQQLGATGSFLLGAGSLAAVVICGEVVPKNTAVMVYRPFGRLAAFPIYLIQLTLLSIVLPLEALANWIVRLTGGGHDHGLRARELQQMVSLGTREGALDSGAGRMLSEVIGISDVQLNELMVPRVEMVSFDLQGPPEELLELFRRAKHTLLPVYDGEVDNVLGVVHVKDVLYRDPEQSLRELVRPIPFLPETATVEDALTQCKGEHTKTAFVVDEYGAVVGLVTMEDLLEEIVGEMNDEYDVEGRPPVELLSDGSVRLQGRLGLRTWEEMFGVELPEMGVTTLGGLVMRLLERVPEQGDEVEYEGIRFTVESVQGRRVATVRMRARPGMAQRAEEAAADA